MHGIPSIIPLHAFTAASELEARFPGDADIHACDFYVSGAEDGVEEAGGFRMGRILNVDHHAPTARMQRRITSTALACAHVESGKRADPASCVVINHTDCDSILSSAIMLGQLLPDQKLVDASISADHMGSLNPIADLLQALDEGRAGQRSTAQYEESVRNLELLLDEGSLEPVALMALERRESRRAQASRAVDEGSFDVVDGLAVARLETEVDGAFFPALLENVGVRAEVIMVASASAETPGRWIVKLRLGSAAPDGLSLQALGIGNWDPQYGGRWNAGSNKRGKGSSVDPADYAARLREQLLRLHSSAPPC